jgi:lysophospholipase L1-like esterase
MKKLPRALIALRWAILMSFALNNAPPIHAQLVGVGAMGDSLSDEYDIFSPRIYGSEGRNWVERLAQTRSTEMDFGAYSTASRGAPRYTGYAHNWARSGATSATLLSEGQHTGLAEQVAGGEVSLVYLGIGANDFVPGQEDTIWIPEFGDFSFNFSNTYWPIYFGQYTDQQVADRVDNLVRNFTAALDAVESAGAKVAVGTAPDYGVLPGVRKAYRNPERRQRVTDAVLAANAQIKEIALSRGVPVIDLIPFAELYYSSTPVLVGGVPVTAENFFLADGTHASTLIQGLLANAFIAAANEPYGTHFTPLSGAEILANADISPPSPLGPTFDPSTFVILPSAVVPEPCSLALVSCALGLASARHCRSHHFRPLTDRRNNFWGIRSAPRTSRRYYGSQDRTKRLRSEVNQ